MSTNASSATAEDKICCSCGAALEGVRRYKDVYGQYWCIPCAEKDQKQRHGEKIKCPDCGKYFHEDAFIVVELTKVCPRCHKERMEIARKNPVVRRKKFDGIYSRHEKQRLRVYVVIVAVLLSLAVWQFNPFVKVSEESGPFTQLLGGGIVMCGTMLLLLILGIIYIRRKL